MKKTKFKGVVNGHEFDNVNDYNACVQAMIDMDVDYVATCSTEVVDEPEDIPQLETFKDYLKYYGNEEGVKRYCDTLGDVTPSQVFKMMADLYEVMEEEYKGSTQEDCECHGCNQCGCCECECQCGNHEDHCHCEKEIKPVKAFLPGVDKMDNMTYVTEVLHIDEETFDNNMVKLEDELANLLDIIEKSIPNNTTHQLQVYLTGVQEVMGKMDSHLEQLEIRLEQLKLSSFSKLEEYEWGERLRVVQQAIDVISTYLDFYNEATIMVEDYIKGETKDAANLFKDIFGIEL